MKYRPLFTTVQVPFSNTIVTDHVMNGDHDIINKTSLPNVIAKGLIYSEPKSIKLETKL